jgi:hypothetical protein
METYIVQIYRHDPEVAGGLIGHVEEVGVEEIKVFKNLRELQEILACVYLKIGKKGIKQHKLHVKQTIKA